MTITIYGDLRTGVFAVEAALAEAGADYAFERISLRDQAQKSPAFLAINPAGKVPALRWADGTLLTELVAILLAIAERFPQAALLPPPASDARAQAFAGSLSWRARSIRWWRSPIIPNGLCRLASPRRRCAKPCVRASAKTCCWWRPRLRGRGARGRVFARRHLRRDVHPLDRRYRQGVAAEGHLPKLIAAGVACRSARASRRYGSGISQTISPSELSFGKRAKLFRARCLFRR